MSKFIYAILMGLVISLVPMQHIHAADLDAAALRAKLNSDMQLKLPVVDEADVRIKLVIIHTI